MQYDDWPPTMLWLLLVISEQKGAWDGVVVAHVAERWLGLFFEYCPTRWTRLLRGRSSSFFFHYLCFCCRQPPISCPANCLMHGPFFLMA